MLPQLPWEGLKKKLSTAALCRDCYGRGDGAANQLSPPKKQKEKAVAFLWYQSADWKGDWERAQGMGRREGGPEEDKARASPSPSRFH